MDALIWCKRRMQPIVNGLRLNRLFSPVYQQLVKWRYGDNRLAVASQNGRMWKLHPEVALRGEVQEFETILWLRKVVKPGDYVIDIGANVGQMTLEAAELVGPQGKVLAIEPAPGNVRLLKMHIEANGFADRVEIVQAACGGTHGGQIVLNIFGNSQDAIGSGHNILQKSGAGEQTHAVTVPLISLDGICQEKNITPNVIKIDVEGAELDLLQGVGGTLARAKPFVQIGFHPFAFADPVEATQKMIETFRSCGYETPLPNSLGQYELAEYHMNPITGRE